MKRVTIFSGHYGSGKTNIAVNYALKLAAEGKKTSLADAGLEAEVTKALANQAYTGSAIEPLKDIFSNLVLAKSATVADQKLVLGTDYDLTYTCLLYTSPSPRD